MICVKNPRMSYQKKNGIYAIYVKHNMFFLKGLAAILFDHVLSGTIDDVPVSFWEFLKKNEIVVEVES
jgi:hypothetical protein